MTPDSEAETNLRSTQCDLGFTGPASSERHIEHPLLLVVSLLYGDHMLYGGALQPQRVRSAVQYHHHLITLTENHVIALSLIEQVGLYDGGGR